MDILSFMQSIHETRRSSTRSAWRQGVRSPAVSTSLRTNASGCSLGQLSCMSQPLDLVSDLPEFYQFMQSCSEAQNLCAEAQSGSRAAALRTFFESCEEALKLVRAERLFPPKPVYWHQTTNNIACLPEDKLDFVAGLRETCQALVSFGMARSVRITPPDSGFFAAFLAVIDNLFMAPPSAQVQVDWRLRGDEQHFTYWLDRQDACVWRELFEPVLSTCVSLDRYSDEAQSWSISRRWNFFFGGRFRWRLRHSRFAQKQRNTYHAIYSRFVRLRHPQVTRALSTIGRALREGVSIGVHKRVDTPGTAAYQGAKRVASAHDYVEAVHRIAARLQRPLTHVFLATDCGLAEAVFRSAFGTRLVMQQDVQRTPGGVNADHTLNEAHIRSAHNPTSSFHNALAVLVDALLLSQCGQVLHMDSNVSSAVSIMNPDLEMFHIADVLAMPEGSSEKG